MGVQSLVQQGYGGYAGWGDAEAEADFRATGGSGKKTGGSGVAGVPDPIEQAKRLQQFQVESNQPAIQSLQASKPEISQRYSATKSQIEAKVEPLKARYQGIIDDLNRRQGVEETSAIKRTATEFGRRGVPLSSGMYANEEAGVLSPIRETYAGQVKDTGLAREDSLMAINDLLAQLPQQETADLRGVENAIAQLQGGNPAAAIQGAMSYLSQIQQQNQFNAQQALAQEELKLKQQQMANDNKLSDLSKNFISLPEGNSLYNLLSGKSVFTAPKTYKSSGVDSGW